MASNTFVHKHYEKVILAGLLLVFSGLLYLQLAVVKESQAKKVDDIVNAKEPPADFVKNDYSDAKYSKESLFDEKKLSWNALWKGENPFGKSEYTKNVDMMIPMQMALCKHDAHMTYAGSYPKKDSKEQKNCDYCGKLLDAPKNEVAQALEEETVDNDVNKNGIPDDWEKEHHFEVVEVAEGTVTPVEDTDGDGFDNKEEYKAGTLPRDPGSHPLFVTKLTFDNEKKVEDIPFEKYINVKELGEITAFKLESCNGSEKGTVQFSYKDPNGKTRRTVRCQMGKEILYKNVSSSSKQKPTIGFKVEKIGSDFVDIAGKDGKVKSQKRVFVVIASLKNSNDKFTCYLNTPVQTGRKSIPLMCQVEDNAFGIKLNDKETVAKAEFKIGDEITLGSDYSIEKYTIAELKGTDQEPVLLLKNEQGKIFEIKSTSVVDTDAEVQKSAE